jgi:uncharacterized membrane protein YgcG/tetratricopeptide (TPR) repeat protein
MFYSPKRNTRSLLSLAIFAFAFLFSSTALAQSQEEGKLLPAREGSVTDFASVIDYNSTKRLENMLANLKERAGLELAVVTVKTTGGKDIFDYSQRVAREWNVGSIQSKEKSLLLVVSTEDGKFFTQVSRRARGELPDGLLGEMGSRMREPFSKGSYSEGLLAAVETFITKMAERRGFSTEGMDQAREAPANPGQQTQETPTESPKQTAASTETTTTPKEPQVEATGAEVAAKEPAPEATPTPQDAAPKATPAKQSSVKDIFTKPTATKTVTVSRNAPEKAELDELLKLPPAERIEKLKAFIEAYPRSPLKPFAAELIVSAHATLGDEKLKAGDAAGGVEQFQLAITASPEKMSDALFLKVVSQLPWNLYLRGQRTAAFEASRQIESKVKDDPKRLLALANFFLSIEEADEAARLGDLAVKLAPDMAAAHQVLGASRHISLRLDEAATEYARALELDPKHAAARRSLADLRRATGKTEEALALYREQLTIDPADKPARAGIVLSLFELGKKDEAEREMEAALKDDPNNLALLVGASYWHAAKGDSTRAQELATKAIELEPRYIWAHIAMSRALLARKRPLEAERILRFARQYGNFPTLDYEMATSLAAAGFYEEAAAELARSFTIKDGQIETRLAGRVSKSAPDFTELLAPERRAGIFQVSAADTEANARMLKGLLAFSIALNAAQGRSADAAALKSAQADFLTGEDGMLAYRQLYAASRLLSRGVELNSVIELTDAATGRVDAALDVPLATVAVMADELREARTRAFSTGEVLSIGEGQRNVLSNILRGRIEDIRGWALFNQDKASEALTHFRRALSVLPENTVWWRTAQWHMGAALEATGSQREALAAYMKAYNPAAPSPVQRAIIEGLYRKLYGSLDGLDAKIGAASSASSNTSGSATPTTPPQTPDPAPATPAETPTPTPEQKPPASEQPKTEGTEQKPVEEKHPAKQP